MRTAEGASRPLLKIFSFLVPDHHALVITNFSEPGQDGSIVTEMSVSVQFEKFVEGQRQVVRSMRPLRVASNLDRLPGSQVFIDLLGGVSDLIFQVANGILDA